MASRRRMPTRAALPVASDVGQSHLVAFAAHMQAGRTRAALASASEACHEAPRLPQAHYAYGEAWLALGGPGRAEQAFAAAIKLAPGWADAWVYYGLSRYRQGAIEDATTAMRHALRHAPEHPGALANLGAFLRVTGYGEAAQALLCRSVADAPGNAGARLNLAVDMLREGRAAEALALLDAAPELPADPRARRHWLLQKSMALLHLDRADEARGALDALAAIGPIPSDVAPLWHWRRTLLALAGGDPDEARRHAGEMSRAIERMGPDAVPEHRIVAHYDLATFWLTQGDNAAAFACWTAGHALLRQVEPFSRADHGRFVDGNIAAFTDARFAAGAVARNADAAPVFIVGMPRSGTTLCERILAAHGSAHGAGERSALRDMFTRLGGADATAAAVARVAALDADALDAAANSYLAELHALAPDKARIVDKLPANYLFLGLVGLLFPGARVIHCVRDPRDIGLSIFSFRFHGSHGYAHDLGDLGWTIAQHQRLMAHWREALPNPILTVKLSDWVGDFGATLARVLAHVDLPHDPNCDRFHQAEGRARTASWAQVREPVNARGLGRWRSYERHLGPLIAELDRAGALDAWRDAPTAAPPTHPMANAQ